MVSSVKELYEKYKVQALVDEEVSSQLKSTLFSNHLLPPSHVVRAEAGNEIRLKLLELFFSKIGVRKTIISLPSMPPKLTFCYDFCLFVVKAQIELSDDSISSLGPAINSVADITKAAIRDQIQVGNL